MNLEELTNWGFSLADEAIHSADKTGNKATKIQAGTNDLLILLNNPEMLKKIDSSELLRMIPKLPEAASLSLRCKQFEQLAEVVVIFASSQRVWEKHFQANYQKYDEIWETINEGLQLLQEKHQNLSDEARQRGEHLSVEFTKDLAIIKEIINPVQKEPCLPERLENGISCNQSDLVKVKKFPTMFADNQKIDVVIEICSKCGQLYKEITEIEESSKQIQIYFLKPNETNTKFGFHFSNSEAEEFSNIDFAGLVNPGLNETNSIQAKATELLKADEPVVYEETLSLNPNITIESFINVFLPLLQVYGVTNSRAETYLRKDERGFITNRVELIGDPQQAHLRYAYSSENRSGSDGYEKLQGVNLIHPVTAEILDLSIEIDLLAQSSINNIKLLFEGGTSTIEKFKEAVRFVIGNN